MPLLITPPVIFLLESALWPDGALPWRPGKLAACLALGAVTSAVRHVALTCCQCCTSAVRLPVHSDLLRLSSKYESTLPNSSSSSSSSSSPPPLFPHQITVPRLVVGRVLADDSVLRRPRLLPDCQLCPFHRHRLSPSARRSPPDTCGLHHFRRFTRYRPPVLHRPAAACRQ